MTPGTPVAALGRRHCSTGLFEVITTGYILIRLLCWITRAAYAAIFSFCLRAEGIMVDDAYITLGSPRIHILVRRYGSDDHSGADGPV